MSLLSELIEQISSDMYSGLSDIEGLDPVCPDCQCNIDNAISEISDKIADVERLQ